jgi:hypothetical protein
VDIKRENEILRNRFVFILLILPLLGIVLGILSAFVLIHGLAETWQFVGKPSSKIDKIIGLVGKDLFVSTDKGEVYYLPMLWGTGNLIPIPVRWVKEENTNIEPDPIRKYGSFDFIALPPLFKVKQIYEIDIPMTEGRSIIKFALSEDGNLWAWQYSTGSLAPLTYFIFPIIGGIAGLILAISILIGAFLMKMASRHMGK